MAKSSKRSKTDFAVAMLGAQAAWAVFAESRRQQKAEILDLINRVDRSIVADKHFDYAFDAMFEPDGTSYKWHRFHGKEEFPSLLMNLVLLIRMLRNLPYGSDPVFRARVKYLAEWSEEEGEGWHGADAYNEVDFRAPVCDILVQLQLHYQASDQTMRMFVGVFGYLNQVKFDDDLYNGLRLVDTFAEFASHFAEQ